MSMNVTKLDEKLSVTGQIVTGQISMNDLHEIAASGYKAIICNRPDFEGGAEQPTSEQLEELAKSLGIVFVYLPVEIGGISAEHGEKFKELVDVLPGPILAFCGSGKRATALCMVWQKMLHRLISILCPMRAIGVMPLMSL
jgi:sulfide:quinone oxidoreductase